MTLPVGSWAPPVPAATRRREWPSIVLAIAVVLLLAGGITVVVTRRPHGPAHPGQWDPRVLDIVRFDEKHRGLKFDHPVFVDFLTPEQYSQRARSGSGELTDQDKQQLQQQEGELRAMGLVKGEVDLFQAGNDLADNGTLAFYDPETQRVSVRGTDMSVELRVTLAHELTHALQDQHFGIGTRRTNGFTTTGEATAFRALLEGDAVRIEDEYIDSLSADEQKEYDSANAADVDQATKDLHDVPVALQALDAAPYIYGPPFAQLLDAIDGNAAVDDATKDPPTTDEQEIDPRAFEKRDDAVDVATPSLPSGVTSSVDSGDFGALAWFLVLAERVDPLVALHAVDGWGGDAYVAYQQDARLCMRLDWQGDSSNDEHEMKDALDQWAAAMPQGAATVDDRDGTIHVQSCDLGPAADLQVNDRGLDVLQIIGLRTQLMEDAVRNGGLSVDDAFTYGNCVLDRLGTDQVQALLAVQSADLPANLRSALTSSEDACFG